MMDGLKTAIESRVNALGVSETNVQQMGETRLLIEIPNVSDPKLAREFIRKNQISKDEEKGE